MNNLTPTPAPGAPPAPPQAAPPGAPQGVKLSPQDLLQMLGQALSMGVYQAKNPTAAKAADLMPVPGTGTMFPEDEFENLLREGESWAEGAHPYADDPQHGGTILNKIVGFLREHEQAPFVQNVPDDRIDNLVQSMAARIKELLGVTSTEKTGSPTASNLINALPKLLKAQRDYEKAIERAMEELRQPSSKWPRAMDALRARASYLNTAERAGLDREALAESPLAKALLQEQKVRDALNPIQTSPDLGRKNLETSQLNKVLIETLLRELLHHGEGQF